MTDRVETSTVEERHRDEPYCYLTTTGRASGRLHEIEIWFVAFGDTIYLMNGGGERRAAGQSDWVLNLREDPAVTVRIADQQYRGTARLPEFDGEEHERIRDPLMAKYQPTAGYDLTPWRTNAVPVAIDLVPA